MEMENEHGNLERTTTLIADLNREIAERKKTEMELRRSEERFRQVAENAGEFIWEVDRTGLYTYANGQVEKILGYTPEEVVGRKHFYDFFTADAREDLKKGAFEVFARQEAFRNFVNPNLHKDGHLVILETSGTPIVDSQGNPIGYRGVDTDVTERKRLEEQTRQLHQQIEWVLGATKTGLDIIDSQFHVRYIDPEWKKVYGDPQGKTCYEYFMDRNEVCPGCGIVKALETKQPAVTEETLVRENNRVVQVTSMPFQGENGEWLVAEVNVDITERKRAEEKLANTAALLRDVINTSTDLIFLKDLQLRTILCNEAYARAVGKHPEELYGKTDIENGWNPELVRGDPAQGIRGFENDDREALRGQVVHNMSDPANVAGEIRIFDTVKLPLRDASGMIIGVLGVSREATERKRAEQALQESEGRFRSLVEQAGDGFELLDAEGRYVDVNSAICRQLGYSRDEMLHRSIPDIDPLVSQEKYAATFQALVGRAPITFESVHRRKDGTTFPVEITASVIQIGGVPRALSLARDITERRHSMEMGGIGPQARLETMENPRSPAMKATVQLARAAARRDSVILLQGESGAGKDYLARFIHDHSDRRGGPYFSINCAAIPHELAEKLSSQLHLTIKAVTEDIQKFSYNTALARLMELINHMSEIKNTSGNDKKTWEMARKSLTLLIAPFAPHLAEEIWQEVLKEQGSVHAAAWPTWDQSQIKTESITVIVQVNGKVRSQLQLSTGAAKDETQVKTAALALPQTQRYLNSQTIKNTIFVPGRLINFVI